MIVSVPQIIWTENHEHRMGPAERSINNQADRKTLLDKTETIAQRIGSNDASTALPTPAVSYDVAKLDKHLAGGIAWSAGAKWSSQILSWASTLVVARLLLPSDFGLVGMAAVYLSLMQNFTEFGFGSAVITLRDLTDDQIAQINAFSVFSGAAGFLISCVAAIPLGWFFRSMQLPAVIVVMSTGFVMSGFRTVPYSLLQRNLSFKLLSIIETVAALAQALGTLILALFGLGYWALILGNIIGAAASTGLNISRCPCGFALPRLRSIGHALKFSWQVLVTRLAWNFYSDADFLVAGRVLGAAPLGAYTLAWNLATLPMEKVSTLLGRVTPALFSAVQTEPAALRRYLRNLTEALALITLPATLGLALTAREFVTLVLGKKWLGVIAPLELLAFYAAFRSIATLLWPILTALRETRFTMWDNLAGAVLLPSAFYAGSRWGTAGIAWAWIVAYPIIAIPLYARTFRRVGMSAREYLGAVRPALNGSIAMTVAVCVLKWVLPPTWPLYVCLVVEVLTGAATYVLVIVAFHRARLRAFKNVALRLRS
jgi:O-antigen/teichoic acid export membrane protein